MCKCSTPYTHTATAHTEGRHTTHIHIYNKQQRVLGNTQRSPRARSSEWTGLLALTTKRCPDDDDPTRCTHGARHALHIHSRHPHKCTRTRSHTHTHRHRLARINYKCKCNGTTTNTNTNGRARCPSQARQREDRTGQDSYVVLIRIPGTLCGTRRR